MSDAHLRSIVQLNNYRLIRMPKNPASSTELTEYSVLPHVTRQRELPILIVLAGIQFTHIMDFMIVMPLGPQYMRLFSIGPQQFSLLISAYTFAASAAGFIAALYIDRFDRKNALLILYACFALATLFCALAPDYGWLLLARSLAGAFGGLIGATVFAIVADIVPQTRRGAATGTVMSAFSLAAIAGVPAGLFLANHWGWRAPFIFLTLLSTTVWIAARLILPRVKSHLAHRPHASPFAHLSEVFSNKNHIRAFLLIACLMFAGFSVIPLISPYMVANVGLSEADLPYLYFGGGLMTLFTARWIGKMADHHGARAMFLWIAAISIFPILLLTHLPPASLPVAVFVMILFMMFVSGRFVPAMALITSAVVPHLRGSFMSFHSSIQQLAAGLAALTSGWIVQKSASGALIHYGWVGILAVFFTLCCMIIVYKIKPLF